MAPLKPVGKTTSFGRLHGVDALRGMAIIAVVLLHINIRFHLHKEGFGALVPLSVMRVVFWSGSYSVKVFFVVSGFLITSSVLGRWGELGKIDWRRFYWLRFARIGPSLLALLGILSVLHLCGVEGFVIKRATLPRALGAALTFHVNWLESKVGYLPGSWDVLWSLSVEEVFYLAYPLLCRFARCRWILFVLVAGLVCVGPLYRTVWASNEIAEDYWYLSNMDGIAMGCVAAVVARRWELSPRARAVTRTCGWALFLVVMVFRGVAMWLKLTKTGLDVTALEWGTALIVLAMAQGANLAYRWTAWLRWFGRNSYEVYLTHMFVVTEGTLWFARTSEPVNAKWIWCFGMVGLSGLLGAAVNKFYSERMNALLRRY